MSEAPKYCAKFEPGQKIGRLTIVQQKATVPYVDRSGRKQSYTLWTVLCECGKTKNVRQGHLASGHTTSCGCFRADATRERSVVHGETDTRLFRIWKNIIQRCTNPKNPDWHRYGGRGITIHAGWSSSYETFRDWAQSAGYDDRLELDRIDNDGGYSPDNCRFVTHAENIRNSSSAKLSADKAEKIRREAKVGRSVSSMADEYGVKRAAIENVISGKTWKTKLPESPSLDNPPNNP